MPSVCPLQKHLNALSFRCSLADFQIEKKIGRGQFSEVYKATCLLDRRTVALKKVQVSQRPHGVNAALQELITVSEYWGPGPVPPFPPFPALPLYVRETGVQPAGLQRESGGLLKARCEP